MSDYKNIDCNLYDEYILYIMQKKPFRLEDSDKEITIVNIFTRDKEEFLTLSNGLEIRLDKVQITNENLAILI